MKLRSQSSPDSKLRQTVIKDYIYEVDPSTEDESQATMLDSIVEEICTLSFDQQAYKEWIQDKKTTTTSSIC